MEASLDVTFLEPTVGGLTGTQLSLLRSWEEEELCAAEIFPVSPKGPAEQCMEPKEVGSRFCVDHFFVDTDIQSRGYPQHADHEPTYDEYDRYKDREFE